MNQYIILSPMISFSQIDSDSWLLYHLQNHHYIIGGSILKNLVDANRKKITFEALIKNFEETYQPRVEKLFKKLTRMDFFIIE